MSEENFPSIIDAVEFRRDQYGFKRWQWAAMLGMSPPHYTDFIKGRRNLTLKHAARAYELGVPADALFQCTQISGADIVDRAVKAMGWKL
jgi:antitoxin component HigA of HigAB toxin-antitoxin module